MKSKIELKINIEIKINLKIKIRQKYEDTDGNKDLYIDKK